MSLAFYVLPTVVPFFVSTTRLARAIGVVLAGSLGVTVVAERNALTWCFFAALVSALILAMVIREPTRVSLSSHSP